MAQERDSASSANYGTSKKYNTVNKRIDGKQKRIYPELIKSNEYDKLLNEMKIKEKEAERLNEFNEIMKNHMP